MGTDKFVEQFEDTLHYLSKLPFDELPEDYERVEKADELIEEYYNTVGRLPKPYQLGQLSDFILAGDLKDKAVDKVTNTDYPILSPTQVKRRSNKQLAMVDDDMNYLDSKFNKQLDSLSKRSTANTEEV